MLQTFFVFLKLPSAFPILDLISGEMFPFWNAKKISQTTKLNMYMACVRSDLLYGCKSWPTKQSDLKSIQAFENRFPRHILHRRTTTTPTVELLNTARLTPLAKTIQARKLKWLGHVLRMDQREIPNAALEFEQADNWRRPPGGVKQTWRKTIRDKLSKHIPLPRMTHKKWEKEWFETSKEAASDKGQWRGLVRDIMAGNGQ